MATGYYLLDHPNPNGNKFYASRSKTVKYIVIHTAENLPDLQPPDLGAEAVARYLGTTARDASCHECVDSDSFVRMLPDTYTAWHARGANADGWGLEICSQAGKWDDLPASYRDILYRMAANRARRAALALNVPLKRTNFGGPAGFLGHRDIDPTRRSDPGTGFDWTYFLRLVNLADVGVTAPVNNTTTAPTPAAGSTGTTSTRPPVRPQLQIPAFPLPRGYYFGPRGGGRQSVSGYYSHRADLRRWQQRMKDRGWRITVDGYYGPQTRDVTLAFQREKALVPDGKIGANTWRAAWSTAVTR